VLKLSFAGSILNVVYCRPANSCPSLTATRSSLKSANGSSGTLFKTWCAVGLDIPVSVNNSAQQLQEADFATSLNELLAAHPTINPARLEIEVLECSALTDMSLVSLFTPAANSGVSFALDDFGTGYSSLAFLKRLPIFRRVRIADQHLHVCGAGILTLNAEGRTDEAALALSRLHSLRDNLLVELKLLLKRE
jgi:hypothetical protein